MQQTQYLPFSCANAYFYKHQYCSYFSKQNISFFTGNSRFSLSSHPSLDSNDVYPAACAGPRYSTGITKQLNRFQENSFAGPKETTDIKDERNSDFFDGFLAIGTLGGETYLDAPATPTFGMSSGDLSTDNAEVTENDLKRISHELEKFLEAEAKEGNNRPSEGTATLTLLHPPLRLLRDQMLKKIISR